MKYLNPYRLAINLRNYLFEKDKISSVKYPMPVISVGNLTTGGTGKTPVVIELVNLLTGPFNKKKYSSDCKKLPC
jgi:tetraacyldisaccharide-1-P 4'-kinase